MSKTRSRTKCMGVDNKVFQETLYNLIKASSVKSRKELESQLVTILIDRNLIKQVEAIATTQELTRIYSNIKKKSIAHAHANKGRGVLGFEEQGDSLLITFKNHSAVTTLVRKLNIIIEEEVGKGVARAKRTLSISEFQNPAVLNKAVSTVGMVGERLGLDKGTVADIQEKIRVKYKPVEKVRALSKLEHTDISVRSINSVLAKSGYKGGKFQAETHIAVLIDSKSSQAIGVSLDKNLNTSFAKIGAAFLSKAGFTAQNCDIEALEIIAERAFMGEKRETVVTKNSKGKVTSIDFKPIARAAFSNPFRMSGFDPKTGKISDSKVQLFASMNSLRQAIEQELPALIRKRMAPEGSETSPNYLVNRTGNFADNAPIIGIPKRVGATQIVIPFNYKSSQYAGMGNSDAVNGSVYRSFEAGNAQGSVGRDPINIISGSIREAAIKHLTAKFSSTFKVTFIRQLPSNN